MSTFFHINKDTGEKDYDCLESMGIGIGHRDDVPEDTFEGMGIGIGHRDDNEYVQISFFDDDQPLGKDTNK
jgi:hypothetical protein